ncbi:MAG: hypothetical protein U1E05_11045 [Patescibacteria group bacterium]|nr:hypothetical protein [Patescibacteria group bacterium]
MCRIRWFSAFVLGAMFVAAGLGVGVLGPAHRARADLLDVRVDFGNAGLTTPTNWNLVTAANTPYGLKDFNDFAGPNVATLTYSGFSTSGQNQSGLSWVNDQAPWVDSEGIKALYDYIVAYQSFNPGQVIISGLDLNELYNLELLSARSSTTNASYRVNSVTGEAVFPTGGSHTASTDAWNSGLDGLTNQGFMRWTDVSPNSSGQIVIDADGKTTYAFFMGFRLSQVPEPCSALLLAMGVLLACAVRPGRR